MAHKSSSKPWKGSRHCAVIGCTNGDYSLGKWINSICSVYENCMHGTGICDCTQPFELFKFPAKLKNPDGRRKWIQILNRDKPGGNKWSPSHGSRVCSRHFIEGAPTHDHPFPTENLGYDSKRKVDNILNQGVFCSPPRASKAKRQKSTECSFTSVC